MWGTMANLRCGQLHRFRGRITTAIFDIWRTMAIWGVSDYGDLGRGGLGRFWACEGLWRFWGMGGYVDLRGEGLRRFLTCVGDYGDFGCG